MLREYKCKVSTPGSGISTTMKAKCFGPVITRSGQEILLIDTRGLNDIDPFILSSNTGKDMVRKLISEFIN